MTWRDVPFIESPATSDICIDGIERFELIGRGVRAIYWRWRYEQGVWVRAGLDFAIMAPRDLFKAPPEKWAREIVCAPTCPPRIELGASMALQ